MISEIIQWIVGIAFFLIVAFLVVKTYFWLTHKIEWYFNRKKCEKYTAEMKRILGVKE